MSGAVDERVVGLQFDNKQFEQGVQISLQTIQKLKDGLDLDAAAKGLSTLQDIGQRFSLAGLADGVDSIAQRFTNLGIVGITVLQNITNAAIQAGAQMLRSLTIDPAIEGFSKYERMVGATQTIMNSTGRSIEDVEHSLEQLIWFADETSYSFADMVDNVGKFTSQGVELDTAATAMQGIANWAALSGANAQTASRAMYNFSQALGMGSMQALDWRSIENAQMATVEFKQAAIDTAIALGTLDSAGRTANGTMVDIGNFRDTLKDDWFSNEVILETLNQYGEYSQAVFEKVQETGLTAAEAMALVSSETMDLGARAFRAAQEAKTFTDALDATKDAASSVWMQMYEAIFGNYEEAKVIWTDMANGLYDIFVAGGAARAEMLGMWKDMGGRDILLEGIYTLLARISDILRPIGEAWSEIFPETTATALFILTDRFRDFIATLEVSEETTDNIKRTFAGLFALLDLVGKGFAIVGKTAATIVGHLFPIAGALTGITAPIGDLIVKLNEAVEAGDFFGKAFETIKTILSGVSSAITEIGRAHV